MQNCTQILRHEIFLKLRYIETYTAVKLRENLIQLLNFHQLILLSLRKEVICTGVLRNLRVDFGYPKIN